jgi:hypothetical protein
LGNFKGNPAAIGQASVKRIVYSFYMRESGAKKMNLFVGDVDMYDVTYCW